MNNFEDKLRLFFSGRIEDLLMESRKTNRNYRMLSREYFDLLEEMLMKLEEKDRELLFQLEETQNQIASIDIDSIYFQGILDCISLLKIIQII
ncbi:MAG: hypothetical protein KHW59_04055 [Clostridiales bacterium]|nr:hypothetical protein [Clostridiales bacterium]